MEHSIISPSSMARISKCHASVSIQRLIPEDDRPHETRDIGTAVHWANEMILRGTTVPVGAICPDNGIVITQEMLNRGKLYIDLCRGIKHTGNIEERIECRTIHPECFGTADYWTYDESGNHLTVIDYKDGYIDVSPVENPQAITYVSGIIDIISDGGTNSLENNMTVDIIIIQPRSGGIKTWNTRATDLRPFINQYAYAAHQALSDNPESVAGEHCKYCTGRAVCKSLSTTVQNLVHIADSAPVEINIAQEYEFLLFAKKLIDSRLTAVEAQCMIHPPEGYEVGTGRGRKSWKNEQEAIATASLYGVDIQKAPALITPIQATNAGIPKEIIDTLSNFTSGKPCLKKIDIKALSNAFKNKEK